MLLGKNKNICDLFGVALPTFAKVGGGGIIAVILLRKGVDVWERGGNLHHTHLYW